MFDSLLQKRRCVDCNELKPLSEYNKDKSRKDGLRPYCKTCHSKRTRGWETNNPDKFYSYQKSEKRITSLAENFKRWLGVNPDARNVSARKSYWNNPDKERQRIAVKSAKRRAAKQASGENFTKSEWEELKRFYNHTCLRCKRREPEIKLSPDHVKPLAKGGSNSIRNIQPLCTSCNFSKGAKHIDYR